MNRTGLAGLVMVGLLTLCSCSGHEQGSASGPPPSTPPSTPATTPATGPTPAAPPTRPRGKVTGPATADSQQQRVSELSTAGGVASVVVRLTASGTVPQVRTEALAVGQTLRLVVVSPAATHLTGAGLGVDADIAASSPTAVDVVSFTAGSYAILTRAGVVVLRVTVTG